MSFMGYAIRCGDAWVKVAFPYTTLTTDRRTRGVWGDRHNALTALAQARVAYPWQSKKYRPALVRITLVQRARLARAATAAEQAQRAGGNWETIARAAIEAWTGKKVAP